MATPLHRVTPERLRHVQGESLLRRDFADQAAQDDQLRWWHNRALHNAYGIVIGLTVKIRLLDGVLTAKVSPGMAIDVFGRELVIEDRRFLEVPDEAAGFLLVLGYQRSATSCTRPDSGFCLVERFPDSGTSLRWISEAEFTVRDGVPLATNNEKNAFSAPRARALTRPRIGRGTTIAGQGAWEPWIEDRARLGLQTVIDTSASGFTRTPCYFAEISSDVWNPQMPLLLLAAFWHITEMSKDQFTLRLLIPWLYAQTDQGIAAFMAEGPPPTEPIVDVHEHELRMASPQARRPSLNSAVRGVSRATGLTVTWIGIQRDIDGMSFTGASDRSENDEFS